MKSPFICSVLLAVALCLAVRSSVAQEALRLSLAGEAASAARRQALEEQTGNIRIGRADLFVGAGLGLEFNDNVNYSDQFRQEDFIFRPDLNTAGSLPLSEVNALYLSLDLSYAKYVRYDQYDHLLIAPGSQLGLDIYVKDFHFNLHDQVSASESPVAQGTISGVGTYDEFANTAGLSVDWDLNDLVASFGFDHQNAISTTSYFSYLDRSSESFFARAAFQLSQAVTAGPEASIGLTAYDRPLLNDSLNYSLDLYADWQASAHLHIKPRFGYTYYSFDPVPLRPTPPDASSYFFALELTQRMNDFVDLSIDAGRELRLGINSDLIDLWYARPKAGIRLSEKFGLDLHMLFEQGADTGNPLFVPNERYTLIGGGLSTSLQLMEKVVLRFGYDYAVKSSDIALRSYHQNKVVLELQYTF